MKTTFISKENNDVKFTMDFTADEFRDAVVKAYQATKDQFVIDGFRKGKAPRSIIEKHYGEGIFFEDAINNLFADGYPEAVKELELEVIDNPAVNFSEVGKDMPLTITINVPVYPIIEEVKDYFGVEVELKKVPVVDEDVERELATLQKRNARLTSVDAAAEDGDTVILDYAGFVGEEQFEGGTAENQELTLGSGMFIPGFEEQLVGVSAGEKKDVVVTFPEEYHAADLAGKEAVFHCTVHEVKVEEIPVLDDEFAKDVSEFDTLDEFKAATKEKLQKYADDQSVNMAKDAVVDKVYEANKVEVPEVMVNDEIDKMLQDLDQQLRYQGLSVEQYLQFMQKELNDFRGELREDAEKKVVTRLVLMSIVAAENIDVTDEEMDSELEIIAAQYGATVDQMKEMLGDNIAYLKKDIQLKKVIDMLYDKAVVTEVEFKPEVTEVEAE